MTEMVRGRGEEFDAAWVRAPRGDRPPGGWPVLLFLHGCGEHGGAYVVHAERAAEQGFAGIAPSGPVATRGGGRAWPADGFAATDEYLREVLDRCAGREALDRNHVFLGGFSQGATHAVGLLASRPGGYRGAWALSPGEGPPLPAALKPGPGPRPLYVGYGQNEYPAFRKKARRCAGLWRRAGWPCRLETHPGSHHFPLDWDRRFAGIVRWLEAASRQAEEARLS